MLSSTSSLASYLDGVDITDAQSMQPRPHHKKHSSTSHSPTSATQTPAAAGLDDFESIPIPTISSHPPVLQRQQLEAELQRIDARLTSLFRASRHLFSPLSTRKQQMKTQLLAVRASLAAALADQYQWDKSENQEQAHVDQLLREYQWKLEQRYGSDIGNDTLLESVSVRWHCSWCFVEGPFERQNASLLFPRHASATSLTLYKCLKCQGISVPCLVCNDAMARATPHRLERQCHRCAGQLPEGSWDIAAKEGPSPVTTWQQATPESEEWLNLGGMDLSNSLDYIRSLPVTEEDDLVEEKQIEQGVGLQVVMTSDLAERLLTEKPSKIIVNAQSLSRRSSESHGLAESRPETGGKRTLARTFGLSLLDRVLPL